MKKAIFSGKGQLFSGDIAIATLIFLAALSATFYLWNSVGSDIERSEDLSDMERMATESAEQLIRTPGDPGDWNRHNVKSIGLATYDRVINESKAIEFLEMMNQSNYEDNMHKLQTGRYGFYMNLSYLNGSMVSIAGTGFSAGMRPVETTESLAIRRTVIYNDSIARLNLILWR